MNGNWITKTEAAKAMSVTLKAVNGLIRSGELASARSRADARQTLVLEADVRRVARRRAASPEVPPPFPPEVPFTKINIFDAGPQRLSVTRGGRWRSGPKAEP